MRTCGFYSSVLAAGSLLLQNKRPIGLRSLLHAVIRFRNEDPSSAGAHQLKYQFIQDPSMQRLVDLDAWLNEPEIRVPGRQILAAIYCRGINSCQCVVPYS